MRFPGADANGHPYQRCLTIITITIHHEVDGRRSESWQFIQILIYLRMSKAHSVLNCIANGMQNVCQFFTSNAHNESGRGQSCSMYLTSGLAGWRKGGGSRSRSYNRNRGETANSNSRTVNCALFQLFRPSVRPPKGIQLWTPRNNGHIQPMDPECDNPIWHSTASSVFGSVLLVQVGSSSRR